MVCMIMNLKCNNGKHGCFVGAWWRGCPGEITAYEVSVGMIEHKKLKRGKKEVTDTMVCMIMGYQIASQNYGCFLGSWRRGYPGERGEGGRTQPQSLTTVQFGIECLSCLTRTGEAPSSLIALESLITPFCHPLHVLCVSFSAPPSPLSSYSSLLV